MIIPENNNKKNFSLNHYPFLWNFDAYQSFICKLVPEQQIIFFLCNPLIISFILNLYKFFFAIYIFSDFPKTNYTKSTIQLQLFEIFYIFFLFLFRFTAKSHGIKLNFHFLRSTFYPYTFHFHFTFNYIFNLFRFHEITSKTSEKKLATDKWIFLLIIQKIFRFLLKIWIYIVMVALNWPHAPTNFKDLTGQITI